MTFGLLYIQNTKCQMSIGKIIRSLANNKKNNKNFIDLEP
jgi:hypothetical protein